MIFPRVGRKQLSMRVTWWTVVSVLCLGIFLHLLPFYFMITTSLKTGTEALAYPPTLLPQEISFSAWKLAFSISGLTDAQALDVVSGKISPFYVYLFNSLVVTLVTLALSLPITSLAAYANCKLQRGPIARWTFLFFIGSMMVPAAVTLLPKLLLTLNFPFALTQGSIPTISDAGDPFPTFRIWDSLTALIVPTLFNGFNFLVFKGFFETIPNSVIQAARVDGGSELNIFRRIVLPMSVPVYAFVAWVQFEATWNDFLWPSVAIQNPDQMTLSLALHKVVDRVINSGATDSGQALANSSAMRQLLDTGLSWNGLMVLGLLQTIPVFIMFIVCREYLLKGIRIRGLKG